MSDEATDADVRTQITSARARRAGRDAAGRFASAESTPAASDEQQRAAADAAFDAELSEAARRPTRTTERRSITDLMPPR